MSSSNTRSSRATVTEERRRSTRSTSLPSQQVIIILTNNHEILRHARSLRQDDDVNSYTAMILRSNVNATLPLNDFERRRERLLARLLELELRESTDDFLLRTRRPYPIYFVFRLPDTQL